METTHYVDDFFVFISRHPHHLWYLVEHILITMTEYAINSEIAFEVNEKI